MSAWMRLAAAFMAASAVTCGLSACEAGGRDPVVAQVGEGAITRTTLSHWMAVMAPEHVVPDAPRFTACIHRESALTLQSADGALAQECRQQYWALEQRALGFLISSRWLIGEASDEGLNVSSREARRRAREGNRARASGTTPADVTFTTKAELAAARIRQTVTIGEPNVTEAQIAAYYRLNIRRFGRRERRYFDLVEGLASEAAAREVMQEVTRGRRLSDIANHEWLDWPEIDDVRPTKRVLKRAIFAARPHVLVGPLPLVGFYCFFEVTRIAPAVTQPLSRVHHAIQGQLARERRRRALARFVRAWRRRWIARTDCAPGYVIQKCRQYAGPRSPEDPMALN